MAMSSEEYTGISLFVGSQEIGVLIKDIKEILEPVPILPVPVTHPLFAGLISVRGSIIPVLLLNLVFHASENPFSNKDKKYVVCVAGSETAALDIDAVGDTFSFGPGQLTDAKEDATNPDGLITKTVAFQDKEIPLLSIEKLIQFTTVLNAKEREAVGYSAIN
ncbi:chemotaxis protein CheW [Sporolactobacillus shoreicorticis]|uniref:Chemotaxis protein CheW n=1 Tax=Sporolactobacillus shoreicorticis TaxID=1923877 RepID=A0ABW5SBU1_9BACL|nr:chemotaxis protein CheW [Sporolactobacillus shoreicorticis]MCO7126082.1 chemotaxis protein CheW [Sporolactobacillus shoreicorticis]